VFLGYLQVSMMYDYLVSTSRGENALGQLTLMSRELSSRQCSRGGRCPQAPAASARAHDVMAGQPPGAALGRVKNKAPAVVQITAEQLLREAWDNKEVSGSAAAPPRHQIADAEELAEYQQTKRKAFEDRIVRTRSHTPLWLRYARWEEAQRDFVRARSVLERAIDTDYRDPAVWLAYAEMEMRHKFINHARNVWDRAVTFLPRVPQLWLKYAFMEEVLGNIPLARLVFSRWLKWHPDISAYSAFVRFEERHGSVPHSRAVYEQMVTAHPSVRAFVKYATFEEKLLCTAAARAVYERAVTSVPGLVVGSQLYIAFAKFEERAQEPERARAIYKFATSQPLPRNEAAAVFEAFTVFEKQSGEREGVEAVVLAKKQAAYEEKLAADPRDYDAWFDLIRLEEGQGDHARIRETYKRSVANTPPPGEKRFWRRYIYLWLGLAVWEELTAGDMQRAADAYKGCLSSIPDGHRRFSFGKVWVLAAKLEIRRRDVEAARRLLGHALGVLPHKDTLYREYIAIERALGAIERVRKLYMLWLERNPTAAVAFIEFAHMEANDLAEIARAREIFEVGIQSAQLDEPEALWREYIDFEAAAGETQRVIALYERLLEKSGHVKVWLSYAQHLASSGAAESVRVTREVYVRADRMLKDRIVELPIGASRTDPVSVAMREAAAGDRVRLLDAWAAWERAMAAEMGADLDVEADEYVKRVAALMPRRIKRRRAVTDSRGADAGWEEYYEYVFPEEQESNPKLKILEAARQWKLKRQQPAGCAAASALPPPGGAGGQCK
jgi:crooked neck